MLSWSSKLTKTKLEKIKQQLAKHKLLEHKLKWATSEVSQIILNFSQATLIMPFFFFFFAHFDVTCSSFAQNRSCSLPTSVAANTSQSISQTLGWKSSQTSLATSSPLEHAKSFRKNCKTRCPAARPSKMWVSALSRTFFKTKVILIVTIFWLWRFIVPVFDLFFFTRSLPTFVKRWRKLASPSRQWSASCGPVSWAPSSGIKRRSSSPSKPSNSWRYLMFLKGLMIRNTSFFLIKLLVVILITLCSNTAHCWRPSPPRACLSSRSCWRYRSTATTISTSWRPSRRLWCFFTKVCLQ